MNKNYTLEQKKEIFKKYYDNKAKEPKKIIFYVRESNGSVVAVYNK